MRKYGRSRAAICLACGVLMTQMAGCGANQKTETSTEAAAESVAEETKEAVNRGDGKMVTAVLAEGGEKSASYEAEDLDVSWNAETATGIVLTDSGITINGTGAETDGNTVVIQNAGTYVLSGTMQDGQIRIEAEEGKLVHLVLNGAELSSKTTASIFGTQKCKVVLTLADGTQNKISDAGEYQFAEGEDEPNAPIFMKGDLTINGTGTLEVQGTNDCGIRSKGNLKVVSGTIQIDAADDGLKGKDSVMISGGEIKIVSGGDGIKSNNDKDEDLGYIWIDGGTIVITAQDDGIQAEHALIIQDGSIEITESDEGMEGKSVDIFGGVIKINASDDGINAAGPAETEWEKMQDQEGVYIHIAGGEIRLSANADGVDSNGDLYMDGGELYLSTPVVGDASIIDYNGTSRITGGTVIAAGGTMMMQHFGEESTQNYLVNYYEETQTGGTEIQLKNANGTVLASFAPEKDFEAVIISCPDLLTDGTYQIVTGEQTVETTISEIKTEIGEMKGVMGGFGGPGEGHGGPGGGRGPRPEGEGFPEGMTPPEGEGFSEGMTPPDGKEFPEGMERPEGGRFQEGMTPPEGKGFQAGKRPSEDGQRAERKDTSETQQ